MHRRQLRLVVSDEGRIGNEHRPLNRAKQRRARGALQRALGLEPTGRTGDRFELLGVEIDDGIK